MNNNLVIEKVIIITEQKIIFNDEATFVTSVNEMGKFDILPLHSNFMSSISNYIIIGQTNGSRKKIKINNGILRVKNNKVEVIFE
ncbi:MAG: hypothetical protein KatS3mg090_0675 [Patescibacteria group bacterium]|nr:MAG: hypothetical protein KatS3mg090_0675 [Patescibacteria group bacterium]